MTTSSEFTADGPALVGFLTEPAKPNDIQRGAVVAGTVLGLLGSGPTGVIGQGQGTPGVGVLGQGDGGPGGKFASAGALDAQLNLQPHPIQVPFPVNVTPQEFNEKIALPAHGTAGDFFLGTYEETPGVAVTRCALWLCVTGGAPPAPAIWCQVLLGTAVAGRVV